MYQVTLEEAKSNLADLFEAAVAGEEIFITKDDLTSVQLVPHIIKKGKRLFGCAKGLIVMAADFDEPLVDFKEYTE